MYRYGKQGLEVLLVNDPEENANWRIPNGKVHGDESSFQAARREFAQETGLEPEGEEFIPLECVQCGDSEIEAWAFENEELADLPLRHILKTESPLRLRRKHKMLMEQGAWFCTKEAIKKVFPGEVELIKELLEILSDRNQAKYI